MPIAGLQAGAECPACGTGTRYEINEPGVSIRFIGQAPVRATIYELQKLSCQLCVKLFTAEPPAEAGVPLDHNAVERALKKAILHRKNAFFYKTDRGALVGDIHMSLIHTCELCDANASDYLTALQQHATAVKAAPGEWLPWNYRDAITSLAASS